MIKCLWYAQSVCKADGDLRLSPETQLPICKKSKCDCTRDMQARFTPRRATGAPLEAANQYAAEH